MTYRITLIPGDGIGPEITEATILCLEATGLEFEWERHDAGSTYMERTGDKNPLPDHVLESIKRNKIALKGPIATPVGKGFRSVNVALRQGLDLYACVRPCRIYPGIASHFSYVDLVIIRENTEDLYAGIEFDKGHPAISQITTIIREYGGKALPADAALSLKPISEYGSRRIIDFAFRYARDNGRKRVTLVHKANIMKSTDGLFLDVGRAIAQNYPDIEFDDLIVDNTCMQLVTHPEHFDVIVLSNLYGDIVSDLCAGLVGGLGVAPGANVGTEATVFEATHGTAPQIAGQGIANPLAQLLSGVMMLRHLGERDAAKRLEHAIVEVLKEGRRLTKDLGGINGVGTMDFAHAIVEVLKR